MKKRISLSLLAWSVVLVTAGFELEGQRLTLANMVHWVMMQPAFDKREALREKALPFLGKAGELKAGIWRDTLSILFWIVFRLNPLIRSVARRLKPSHI